MSFLDSSCIPFPVLNDLALIVMASRHPARWPLYAAASTLGSVGGILLLYGVARGGGKFFWRNTPPHHLVRIEKWLKQNTFVTMLVACLLPPPLPLKLFILVAGLLEARFGPFVFALVVGRGLRFTADAWLGARYGLQAQDYLRHNLVWSSLLLVAIIVGLALLQRWWLRLHHREPGTQPEA